MKHLLEVTREKFELLDFTESTLTSSITNYQGGDLCFTVWGLCMKSDLDPSSVWASDNAFMVIGECSVKFAEVCEVEFVVNRLKFQENRIVYQNDVEGEKIAIMNQLRSSCEDGWRYDISSISSQPHSAIDISILAIGCVRVDYNDVDTVAVSKYNPQIHSWFAQRG